MNLRPFSTRWFEVLVPVSDTARTVGMLARTGAVEVEVRPHEGDNMGLQELAGGLAAYREMLGLYNRYWARGRLRHSPLLASPRATLHHALEWISTWRDEAEPLIGRLQSLEEERARLGLCKRVLLGLGERTVDINLVAGAGPLLRAIVAVMPGDAHLQVPAPMLYLTVPAEEEQYLLAVGPTDAGDALWQQVKERDGRAVSWPPWLRGKPSKALKLIITHLDALNRKIIQLYAELDALYEDFDLPDALGDVACLEWFVKHVGSPAPASQRFVWLTGWTSESDEHRLGEDLARGGVRALLHFPPPPAGLQAPQLLRNPWWVRPFELFAKALGIPAAEEVDPSPLLAVIVPLLFGYMFADVGQGLVLVAFGVVFRHRWSIARLLIAGGLSAAVFGFLLGSVFSREDIVPALWLHPLQEPLTVLAVPLVFGIGLLGLGQVLKGLEAAWRGKLGNWWRLDAGFLLFYLGAVAGIAHPFFQGVAVVGACWYLLGWMWAHRGLTGILGAVGTLLENGLRILANTVSFSRVGAFALAHAGLSSALVTLAEVTGGGMAALLVMVLGNAVIIFLEGLVVSVQTTRLVLFEFFNRFLGGGGRVFRPLPLPPSLLRGEFT